MNEDMFRIGVITSTHGLKGEVKVFPTTDDPARFKKLKKCFIRTKSGDVPVEKKSCKFFKNMVILSFSEFNDINEIEKYKGCELYVTREDAVPLEEDEFYIADVIDAEVFEDNGKISVAYEGELERNLDADSLRDRMYKILNNPVEEHKNLRIWKGRSRDKK